jgi:translation initiation factor 5A
MNILNRLHFVADAYPEKTATISVDGDEAQVMDLDTYETFTLALPDGVDLSSDDEIEYLEMEEQRKIV